MLVRGLKVILILVGGGLEVGDMSSLRDGAIGALR